VTIGREGPRRARGDGHGQTPRASARLRELAAGLPAFAAGIPVAGRLLADCKLWRFLP
jgi:hypothetical protein